MREADDTASDSRLTRLSFRFTALICALCLVLALLLLGWLSLTQYNQAVTETVGKAEALAGELDAVWNFIDLSQERINYDSAGSYEYKGLHCAIAGQAVAQIFSRSSGYAIRYVNTTPRNEAGQADETEARAIEMFRTDSSITYYYELADRDGEPVMHYVQKLVVEESCLECHGSPAGEIDITGYPKEGMELGEVGGAISVVMPIGSYLEGIRNNVLVSALIIIGLMVMGFLVVSYAIRRFVTRPLAHLQDMIADVGEGDFAPRVPDPMDPPSEITDLTRRFSEMTALLGSYYENLEREVNVRTSQLTEANERLAAQAAELRAVNGELVKANEIIQRDANAKTTFFSSITHELRTPLTSILAFTEIWGASIRQGKPLDEESFAEIRANCRMLLSMVNNNLALSRLEAGHLAFAPDLVEIAEVVNVSVMAVRPLAEKHHVSLEVQIDFAMPLVEVDEEKMRMVVENLISNAAKYSHRGDAVVVRVGMDKDARDEAASDCGGLKYEADWFFISVEDHGVGIEAEELDRIFDMFVQGGLPHGRYNSSGIGLFLSRQLVEMHHGWIEVQSAVGVGSTFTVHVPVRQSRDADAEAFESNRRVEGVRVENEDGGVEGKK